MKLVLCIQKVIELINNQTNTRMEPSVVSDDDEEVYNLTQHILELITEEVYDTLIRPS